MQPNAEWPRIDAEPATIGGIYRSYVIVLAAIPAISTVLQLLLFVPSIPGIYTIPMGSILTSVLVQYLLTLAGVYVLAMIIDALAPTFGGTRDMVKAFKVAAYSSTAGWVAGVFTILPLLTIVSLIGSVYGLYLLYLGLPLLMGVRRDKAVPYILVTVIAAMGLFVAIASITSRIVYGF